MPCHRQLLEDLLVGLPIGDSDRILFVDLVPNRLGFVFFSGLFGNNPKSCFLKLVGSFESSESAKTLRLFANSHKHTLDRFAEFMRATVEKNLEGAGHRIHYFGFVLEEFDMNRAWARTRTYETWDSDPCSPPKSRIRSEAAEPPPELEVLAWANGGPVFPDVLLQRFSADTEEYKLLANKKVDFEKKYPPRQTVNPSRGPRRAGGECDFQSFEDGRQPLDTARVIELPSIAVGDFSAERRVFFWQR